MKELAKKHALAALVALALGAGGYWAGQNAGRAAGNMDGQLAACGEMIKNAPPQLAVKCTNDNGKVHISVQALGMKFNLDGSEAN